MRKAINDERNLPPYAAENIRRLRNQFGLSCKKLGTLANTDASYIWRIETGQKKRVGYAILHGIAQSFGISTDELLREGTADKVLSLTERKSTTFQQLASVVSKSNLSHKEKMEQLKVIADICQYLLVERL